MRLRRLEGGSSSGMNEPRNRFAHLPADVTRKIVCDNARKFYGLIISTRGPRPVRGRHFLCGRPPLFVTAEALRGDAPNVASIRHPKLPDSYGAARASAPHEKWHSS